MILPVAFVPVITRFPVGLLMYWMTTNLWTIGQGIVTRRLTPKPEPPPKRSSRTPPKEDGTSGNGAEARGPQPKPAPAVAGPPRRVKRKKRKGGR
jgi:YidC/Oxa1 family membrane protein insertase